MPGVDETPKRWRLTWSGRTWTDDDLTGVEIVALVRLLGNDWAQLSPLHGPVHLMTFLTVLSGDAAAVLAAKAADLLDALTLE